MYLRILVVHENFRWIKISSSPATLGDYKYKLTMSVLVLDGRSLFTLSMTTALLLSKVEEKEEGYCSTIN